jgi:mRNA interferase MazF
MNIKRGSIWLANLDPTIGGEIRKTRPVIVVSNDINNVHNNVVTVLPLTSNTDHIYSFEVSLPKGIGNLPKDSKAKADQIRTLDKSRLIKLVGVIPNAYIASIDQTIKLHLKL